MGMASSKCCLTMFEMVNEIFTAVASGIFGLAVLVDYGFEKQNLFKTCIVATIAGASFLYVFQNVEKNTPSRQDIVFITGCDTGLGYSLAQHIHELGYTVVAGFLSFDSKGAVQLRERFGDSLIQVYLDVTDIESVKNAVKFLEEFLDTQEDFRLYAVVNNAGVMVFGEFEWLTERLIFQQININLLGTLLVTKSMCPLLRRYKARLITVSSHCAEACLPGLAVYGATKAGLSAWCDGIRVELGKYGVKVISFIPGSFTSQSNIMANQMRHAYEMHEALTSEQHSFYEKYFKSYHTYLSFITAPPHPVKIKDYNLYTTFENALMSTSPSHYYKNEPFRYFIYHTIFKYSPTFVRDYFVVKFMQMPQFPKEQIEAAV